MRQPRRSSRRAAPRSRFALLARSFACAAVTAIVGVAWLGPSPVEAQLALPTQIPGLPDPFAPPPEGTTTTTTIVPLPTIEQVVPAPSPSPTTQPPLLPELAPAPAPAGGTPAPTAAAKGTRSPVTVKRSTVTDVPPSGRAAAPPGYTRAGPPTSSAAPAEVPVEGGYEEALPFTTTRADRPTGGELRIGVEDGSADRVRNLASAAAGLIAVVLLGVVVWLRGQARPEPAPL